MNRTRKRSWAGLAQLTSLCLATGLVGGACAKPLCPPASEGHSVPLHEVFDDLPIPANGAKDVPLNAHLWLQSLSSSEVVLQTSPASGADVKLTGTHVYSLVQEFAPREELAPLTAYQVSDGSNVVTTFTTGTARATPPPAIPLPTRQPSAYDPSCTVFWVNFTFADTTGFRAMQIEAAHPPEALDWLSSRFLDGPAPASVSTPGDWDGTPTRVRFAAVNVAGQASPWTAWLPVARE